MSPTPVALERRGALAGVRAPDLGGPINKCGEDQAAVGFEDRRVHPTPVTSERRGALAGVGGGAWWWVMVGGGGWW